jgi:hypothetical protein
MAQQTCAFCGQLAEASSMDLTGKGPRCLACTARSIDSAPVEGDLREHLSQQEIEKVFALATYEMATGVGLSILGLVLTLVSVAAGGTFMIAFTGLFAAGQGGFWHGLHRRRQASRALRDAPQAKLIRG